MKSGALNLPRFRCARSRLRNVPSTLFLTDAGWVRGKNRLSDGRRRDAANQPDRLHAQSLAHDRRIVFSERFIDRLALGEQYFADNLNDFDLAANNGGWQWAASTGYDAQPYCRRIAVRTPF